MRKKAKIDPGKAGRAAADDGPVYEGLTPNQARAIGPLMSERTLSAAAAKVGVTSRTLGDWVKQPAFSAALATAEGELIGHTVRRLTSTTGEAVTVMTAIMSDADTPAAIRLRAADAIIGRVITLRELWQLEIRIMALEAKEKVE